MRDYSNSTALANHYYSDQIKNSPLIYFAVSFTITRSCMCKMLLGWTAFYWSELAHECCCCRSLHPKYTTMQGTDGGVTPLKQCCIQFLYKSHMSTKYLTLNAYILITIPPWLKGCVWGNYFWDLLMFALLLLSWYLLVWLKKETITWVLEYIGHKWSYHEKMSWIWWEWNHSDLIADDPWIRYCCIISHVGV